MKLSRGCQSRPNCLMRTQSSNWLVSSDLPRRFLRTSHTRSMRLAIATPSVTTSFRFIHLHSLSHFQTNVWKSISNAGGVLNDLRMRFRRAKSRGKAPQIFAFNSFLWISEQRPRGIDPRGLCVKRSYDKTKCITNIHSDFFSNTLLTSHPWSQSSPMENAASAKPLWPGFKRN